MLDNTKGAGQTDAPADGPCENRSQYTGHPDNLSVTP